MPDVIRPSTVLPANRREFSFKTKDGLKLIGEVATPLGELNASILCLHPNPTGGGMMDSHIYKKASNRLPHLAGIEIIRFNTRGTKSDQGQSEGEYGFGESERFDVEAAIDYSFEHLDVKNLWVMGWSFGTEIALKWARDLRVKGLILLSPPFRMAKESDLEFWANDGRTITALVPEFDDYLKPAEAKAIFGKYSNINEIDVEGGKHLWVGEPQVHLVLSEITKVVAPKALPLPTEI